MFSAIQTETAPGAVVKFLREIFFFDTAALLFEKKHPVHILSDPFERGTAGGKRFGRKISEFIVQMKNADPVRRYL